jgi:hypothetical protein
MTDWKPGRSPFPANGSLSKVFSTSTSWLAEGAGFLALIVYAWVALRASQDANSFHDFLGGRFPVADGYDWLKDALNAASGYPVDYGAKRPLNIPFNVFFLWLGDRYSADPILGTLFIKRLVALGSIFFLVAAVRLRLSLVSSWLVGFLLISALTSVRVPLLPEFLGYSVGYTSGTELNAFILATVAVSILIVAAFFQDKNKKKAFLANYSIGIFLLSMATLMRPGTLLLMPFVVAIFSFEPWLNDEQKPTEVRGFQSIAICLLVGLLSILLAKGCEAIIFHILPTKCGSIGANQAYSLLGMSMGGNYRDGAQVVESMNLPKCERMAIPLIKQLAWERVRENPMPILSLVWNNFIQIFREPSFAITLVLLPLIALRAKSKMMPGRLFLTDRLRTLAWLSMAGVYAMTFFAILFLREAGWRPGTPYVVFPILVYGIFIDALITRLGLGRFALIADKHAGPWNPKRMQSWLSLLSILIAAALLVSMLLGIVIMRKGALGYRGYGNISGAIERPASWLSEWRTFNAISPSMNVMYQAEIDRNYDLARLGQGKSFESDKICIHYQRLQLPWDFPFGKLSIKSGHCK